MHLHRFYLNPATKLTPFMEIKDKELIHQWLRVLRFRSGQEVVLFDGQAKDSLYLITELTKNQASLELIADFSRQLPKRELYLFWSILKKDKNDWVLQKGTELGVSHFIPLLAEHSEKTNLNLERAHKIVIEAAEQCGRSDIPEIKRPTRLQTAVHHYVGQIPLFVCEQSEKTKTSRPDFDQLGVFIGPEGGWSETEKQLFLLQEIPTINLTNFTLRAETAAIAAASKLIQ